MMALGDCLQAHVDRQPDKIFWRQLSGGRVSETTFRQLHARASSFAHAYRAAGLRSAQPILIFLPHGVEAVAAFVGAMLAGAMPSFMPCPSAKQHPSVYWTAHLALLHRIGPHVLVSDQHHAGQMSEHGLAATATAMIAAEDVLDSAEPYPFAQPDPDSVALLQHSSGTTSLKKSVALTHRIIHRQVELYAARLQMRPGDAIVSWLPLYHDMGLIACTVMPLILGQTVTSLDPFEWAARPVSLFEAIVRHGGDFAWMPNFGFEHLVRTVRDDFTGDLSSVRAFINCSEPCKAETFDRFQRRFASLGVRTEQLQVCYAMAETVFAVTQTAMGEPVTSVEVDSLRLRRDRVAADPEPGAASSRVLSSGRPLPGLDVRIRDGGRDLGDNQVGEVVLRGGIVFGGYLNDPHTTSERLSGGFYDTRDLGFTRAGELYVLGRKDDLIIVNGRNLHAHEVEAVAARVPGIKPGRTVAFGVFNDEIGSEELVIVAEREATSDAGDGDLGRALRAAVYDETNIEVKTCRIFDPGWLVKTTSGKISREANRTKYLNGHTGAEPAADRPDRPEAQRVGYAVREDMRASGGQH